MIQYANPTAVAEAQRRRMLKTVEELARDAGNTDVLALCKELRQWQQSHYLGRHPQWHIIRDLYVSLEE